MQIFELYDTLHLKNDIQSFETRIHMLRSHTVCKGSTKFLCDVSSYICVLWQDKCQNPFKKTKNFKPPFDDPALLFMLHIIQTVRTANNALSCQFKFKEGCDCNVNQTVANMNNFNLLLNIKLAAKVHRLKRRGMKMFISIWQN